jgi:hypothetical protein
MRIRSTRLTTALLLPIALLLQFTAEGSAGADLCDRVLGDWAWFIGGKVTFSAGARVRWTPAVDAIPPAAGTWSCAPGTGTYTVTWQNGFIDTVNLSADGTQLSGTSSTGAQVWGQRVSGAASSGATPTPGTTPAAAPGTTPENGLEGWNPIAPQPNQRVRCPGCPIGPDGAPQRIGPQGRPPPKGAG